MVVRFLDLCAPVKAFKHQKLAILLGFGALMSALFSILLFSSSAFAALPVPPAEIDNNEQASWVNRSTISYYDVSFTDSNPDDTSYIFSYSYPNSTNCISTLRFTSSPYTEGGGQNALRTVKVPVQRAGCITTGGDDVRITLAGQDNKGSVGGRTGGGTFGDEDADVAPTCDTGNSFNWIICPLTNLLAGATTAVADVIENLLVTKPLPLNPNNLGEGQTRAIYDVWSGVRNIANIVLVFGFFAIIFSQATSVGISSYGIKKLLPKLVIVSIGINISYFISALMIDVFNILGGGIQGIFAAANASLPTEGEGTTSFGQYIGFTVAAVLAGFISFATIGWAFALPALAIAAAAMLTAFVVLLFREMAIIILVIISPIAFAAWLLPNTESWFGKWRSLFTNLLLMYPLAMIIIWGSLLTSNVVKTTYSDGGFFDGLVENVMSLIIVAVPLFTLPLLLKFAGGVGERIGAFTNRADKGMIDRARKKRDDVKGRTAYQRIKSARKSEGEARKNRSFYNRASSDTVAGKSMRAAAGGMRITPGQREDSRRAMANIKDQDRELKSKMTERARQELDYGGAFNVASTFEKWDDEKKQWKGTNKEGMLIAMAQKGGAKGRVTDMSGNASTFDSTAHGDPTYGKAILSNYAKIGDASPLDLMLHDKKVDQADLRSFIQDNASANYAKMPDLFKGPNQAFSAPSAAEVAGWHASTTGRMLEYHKSFTDQAEDETLSTEVRKEAKEKAASIKEGVSSAMAGLEKNPQIKSQISPASYKILREFTGNPITTQEATQQAAGEAATDSKGVETGPGGAGAPHAGPGSGELIIPRSQQPAHTVTTQSSTPTSQGGPTPPQPTPPSDYRTERAAGGNFATGPGATPPRPSAPADTGTHMDDLGRATPNSAIDDYHDRMNK